MMMHISYRSKSSTPNQAFHAVQEPCFLWERVTRFARSWAFALCRPFTCIKMLHYKIKDKQNPKTHPGVFIIGMSNKVKHFKKLCLLCRCISGDLLMPQKQHPRDVAH